VKRNLLLVAPPPFDKSVLSNMSLALLYLVGAARDAEVCDSIKVFDFNAPRPNGKTIEQFFEICPDEGVVGVNCLFYLNFPTVRELAKEIRRRKPKLKIVIGGMHPTIFAEEIMENCPEFDAVAIGESDNTFPYLLRFLWGECGVETLESVAVRDPLGGGTPYSEKRLYPKLGRSAFPGL
jgi:hypothetical protein